jgi:hypothetical protein
MNREMSSSEKMGNICDKPICNFVKNGDVNYVPGITEIANEPSEDNQKEMLNQFCNIFFKRYQDHQVCIFKRNPDGTNLRLWKNDEYKKNPSIQKLYNIFTQKVTSHCLMNEFIEDNKCELKDIQAIANIMNEESEDINSINDILKTLKLDNDPGLKSGGKLTMKGGNISLLKKFFKINMALMYNDALMTAMCTASEYIITKYINAGINGYRELVTFAFENAYDVQCQQDFLFFLIRNTVSGFYTIKEDIWPFIMANTPILINDIQKGIDTAKEVFDTANTIIGNIDNKITGYIDEKNKESNQKELADHLGEISTEKLNEEHNKALERQGRLQVIKQIYDEKIAKLKIDTAEIKKKQQIAVQETNLIKLHEERFADAFVENEKAKKALNEVNDELQKMIDDAITDNSNIISFTTHALESGRKVAREAYPDTNSVLDFFETTEKKEREKRKNITRALRKAREAREEKEEEDNNEQQQEVTTAQQQVEQRGVKRKASEDNIGGGTRKKRTSRKGKKKASKNRKTKARRARKSRKAKK